MVAHFCTQETSSITRLTNIHNHPRFVWEHSFYGEPSDEDKNLRDKVVKNFPNAQFYIYEQGVSYEFTKKK